MAKYKVYYSGFAIVEADSYKEATEFEDSIYEEMYIEDVDEIEDSEVEDYVR